VLQGSSGSCVLYDGWFQQGARKSHPMEVHPPNMWSMWHWQDVATSSMPCFCGLHISNTSEGMATSEKAHIWYVALQCDTSHFFVVCHQKIMQRLTWFCKNYMTSHISLWHHPKFKGVLSTQHIKPHLFFCRPHNLFLLWILFINLFFGPCLIDKHCIDIFYMTQSVHIKSSGGRGWFQIQMFIIWQWILFINFLLAMPHQQTLCWHFFHNPEHTHWKLMGEGLVSCSNV
jgi:hypothetical protein